MTHPTLQAYHAGFVRRWHTNPKFCATVDPVAYHGGRMAILCLRLFPHCSKQLLAECVCHDLGEYKTGDIPWGCDNKDNSAEIEARKELGLRFGLTEMDQERLKFLDQLDALMWAAHHDLQEVKSNTDWINQLEKVVDYASKNSLDISYLEEIGL